MVVDEVDISGEIQKRRYLAYDCMMLCGEGLSDLRFKVDIAGCHRPHLQLSFSPCFRLALPTSVLLIRFLTIVAGGVPHANILLSDFAEQFLL